MSDHARGQKLRSLREGRRLSQEDAAHEIGVSVRTLRSWEKGKGIKWKNAQSVAKFYGVDPEELVDRELVEASELDPDQLSRIETGLEQLGDTVVALRAELLAELAQVRIAQEDQRSQPAPSERRRAAKQR